MTPLFWQMTLVSCIKANELYYTLINVAASKPNAECTTNHNAKFIIIPSEMLQFSKLWKLQREIK
jgi:hypothetical protein